VTLTSKHWKGSYDSGPTQKYRNECEMTFVWVQTATDRLVYRLWNHCTQCVSEGVPVQRQARLNLNFEENF